MQLIVAAKLEQPDVHVIKSLGHCRPKATLPVAPIVIHTIHTGHCGLLSVTPCQTTIISVDVIQENISTSSKSLDYFVL